MKLYNHYIPNYTYNAATQSAQKTYTALLTAGKKYRVSFDFIIDGITTATYTVINGSNTVGTKLQNVTNHEVTEFTATNTNLTLVIELSAGNYGRLAHIDNLEIAEIAEVGESYRFGFNGKENDNEVKGDGNIYDFGFRIYDSRLGKFLSLDPLIKEFPFYSPYQYASNMPVTAMDLDGLESSEIKNETEKPKATTTSTISSQSPQNKPAVPQDNLSTPQVNLNSLTLTPKPKEPTITDAISLKVSFGLVAAAKANIGKKEVGLEANVLSLELFSLENSSVTTIANQLTISNGASAKIGVWGFGVENIATQTTGTQAMQIPFTGGTYLTKVTNTEIKNSVSGNFLIFGLEPTRTRTYTTFNTGARILRSDTTTIGQNAGNKTVGVKGALGIAIDLKVDLTKLSRATRAF